MADDSKKEEEIVTAGDVNMTSAFWFSEEVSAVLETRAKLNRIMYDGKSKFQTVQVIETGPFGKTLVLDGKTQSALADEAVYHEHLVHPSMLAFGEAKSVFVGGGGEFATTREVLRHKSVERCVMVDIDEEVCRVCREELPEWHDGTIDDPRLEVHYDDAKAWLEGCDEKFDVIIMDIADPIEAGPGIVLYTKEFYEFAVTKLNPGGVLVTQSGPGSIMNIDECMSTIHQTLRTVFKHVLPYACDIPSFGCNWAYNMAFNEDCVLAKKAAAAGRTPVNQILECPAAELDAELEAKLTKEVKILDGVAFKGAFGLPKKVRQVIAAEKRVMTIENPVFMH